MLAILKIAGLLLGTAYNTMLAFEARKRWRRIASLATASLLFGLAVYLILKL